MPEIGIFQLCSVLKGHGYKAFARDLNAEFFFEWFRKEENLLFVEAFLSRHSLPLRSPDEYLKVLRVSSSEHGFCRLKPHETLEEHIYVERRYDNPLTYPESAFHGSKTRLDAGLMALAQQDPRWFSRFVEACHYLLFRPKTSHMDDVLRFAWEGSPILDKFYDDFIVELVSAPPDLVGISIWNTDALAPAMRLSYKIRQKLPNMPIIAGNAWCTTALSLFPTIPEIFDFFDAIVIGYADKVIAEVVRRALAKKSFEGLPNVVFRQNGKVVLPDKIEQVRLRETVLSELPGLRLDLYPDRRLGLRVYDGCPWGKCLFCHHVLQDIHIVGAEPDYDYIEKALDYCAFLVRKYSVARFYLGDHGLPWRFLTKFCEEVLRRDLKIRFEAMAKFDKEMSLETARVVRKAGCAGLHVGVETTNESVLRQMNKGLTLSTIESGIETLSRAGLRICCFILVFPWTSEKDLQDDIEWVMQRRTKIDNLTIQIFDLTRGSQAFFNPQTLGVSFACDISRDTEVWRVPYTPKPKITQKTVKDIVRSVNKKLLEGQNLWNVVLVDSASSASENNRTPDYGLLSVVSMLLCSLPENRHNLTVHLVHCGDDIEQVAKNILSFSPDIVAFCAKEENLECVKSIASHVRTSNERCLIVAGGQAVAPPFDMFSVGEFDCLVCGEGELAFSEIVGHYLLSGKDKEQISGIPNVALANHDKWILHKTCPINPNTIPSPLNLGLIQEPENLFIPVSRACTHGCKFCECARKTRRFTPERLASELINAKNRKARRVYLVAGPKSETQKDIKVVYQALSSLVGRKASIPERLGIFTSEALEREPILTMAKEGYLKELCVEVSCLRATESKRELEKQIDFVRLLSTLMEMIDVSVTLILGAPGYSPEDLLHAVDLLSSNGIPVNMRVLRRTPTLRKSPYFVFAPEPWVHLVESRRFTTEDLRSCANYFITMAKKKGKWSDLTTVMPEDAPFSSWVSMDSILEAHQKFGDPLPPRLGGLLSCLQDDRWRKVISAIGIEKGFVHLNEGVLRFESFALDQITFSLALKDGNKVSIWVAVRKQGRKVWQRTKSFDIWYEWKPSIAFETLKPVLDCIITRLQGV